MDDEGEFGDVLVRFRSSVKSVLDLVEFEKEILAFAVSQVENVLRCLPNAQSVHARKIEHSLEAIRNVRSNKSLEKKFGLIGNQALVLLVSHFASAAGDVFCTGIGIGSGQSSLESIRRAEIKLSLAELTEINLGSPRDVGQLLVESQGSSISFQDMKSIARVFREYFGIDIKKDQTVNDIIVAQACRHSIVHDGGKANLKVLKQVRDALPRTLKSEFYTEDQEIGFSPAELEIVSSSMDSYLSRLVGLVTQKLSPSLDGR
jgi:hypothetical protein